MSTYKELLAQRQELDVQIETARKEEVADAIKQVKTLIQEYSLTVAECGFSVSASDFSATGTTRKAVTDKYVTPDGQHKWTGRGRAPKVFQVLLDAGHKKEEFLI
ncbi:MAG: H-NS histone family protein [Burkholderiales bacterium]|nr:H-NS histone family protein [Burkholderiales bacterium]